VYAPRFVKDYAVTGDISAVDANIESVSNNANLPDLPASARKRKSYGCTAGINEGYPTSENGKLAFLTSGHPAFRQHAKRTEGSDTTPRLARSESTAHRVKKQQHHQITKRSRSPAGPRRLRDSDTHKRIAVPKAFCVLREHLPAKIPKRQSTPF